MTSSAGIMLRNSAPTDPLLGRNWDNCDTLRNQNNAFEGNTISGFGYGILSVAPDRCSSWVRVATKSSAIRTTAITTTRSRTRGGAALSWCSRSAPKSSQHDPESPQRVVIIWRCLGHCRELGSQPGRQSRLLDRSPHEKNRVYDVYTEVGEANGISWRPPRTCLSLHRTRSIGSRSAGSPMHRSEQHRSGDSRWRCTEHRHRALAEPSVRLDLVTSGNRIENIRSTTSVPRPASVSHEPVQSSGTTSSTSRVPEHWQLP